jgi:hypothetical protein
VEQLEEPTIIRIALRMKVMPNPDNGDIQFPTGASKPVDTYNNSIKRKPARLILFILYSTRKLLHVDNDQYGLVWIKRKSIHLMVL